MSYFLKRGPGYSVTDEANIQLTKILPTGTYAINLTPQGYFLQIIPPMELPKKIYGDSTSNADRIINTFLDRPANTGVLLQGEKGSGKTLLAKQISNKLLGKDIVTLVVSSPLLGDGFNKLLSDIEQPAMVMFDEFEKVYEPQQQQVLLTLFDGTFSKKKLFLATTNDTYRVSEYMKNRPGRFFYSLEFKGLDEKFVREYCEDRLKDKSKTEGVINFAATFYKFNFDILQAIVEEMNRYDENVVQASRMLNASPGEQNSVFKITSLEIKDNKLDGFEPKANALVNEGGMINPFKVGYLYIELYKKSGNEDENNNKKKKRGGRLSDYMDAGFEDYRTLSFNIDHIRQVKGSQFTFENEQAVMVIDKHVKESKSYYDYL